MQGTQHVGDHVGLMKEPPYHLSMPIQLLISGRERYSKSFLSTMVPYTTARTRGGAVSGVANISSMHDLFTSSRCSRRAARTGATPCMTRYAIEYGRLMRLKLNNTMALGKEEGLILH